MSCTSLRSNTSVEAVQEEVEITEVLHPWRSERSKVNTARDGISDTQEEEMAKVNISNGRAEHCGKPGHAKKDGWYAKNGQPPSGTGKGKSGQGGQGKGKGKNKDDKAQHEEILSPQQALRRTLLCTRCGNGGTRKGSWRSLHPVCGRPHRQ